MAELGTDFVAVPSPHLPTEQKETGLRERSSISENDLRLHAQHVATQIRSIQLEPDILVLKARLASLKRRLAERVHSFQAMTTTQGLTPPLEFLESVRLFEMLLKAIEAGHSKFARVPAVRVEERAIPRVLHLVEQYLVAVQGIWSQESFLQYSHELQRHHPLSYTEVLLLPDALKLAQLEFLIDRADATVAAGPMPSIEHSPFSSPIHSLRRLHQFEWRLLLEQIVPFHTILLEDPTGAYGNMEEEGRASYREQIAALAKHADCSEVEIAQAVLELSRLATTTPVADARLQRRLAHVGYYLLAEGIEQLKVRIGYHPPVTQKIGAILHRYKVDIYIISISVLSIVLIAALIAPLVPAHEFTLTMGALLLALLPATQGASALVNSTVGAIQTPHALPKMDFSKSIPIEHTAVVAVPTLLINEKQTREIFKDMEVRYLSNRYPNLHFAVLTDLPDSDEKPHAEDRNDLVDLAVKLTNELNAKYSDWLGGGGFLLLHRHRIYNRRQGVWMGWERKRGKLLDLNQLLLGAFDSFPVKVGPIDALSKVRYVITLDSDTKLPRGTAARLVGAMAHPLNQGIVDSRSRIVTAGYGILQPRVGVSVASASRSRLAALYSGETGFDIYTRAVSDVYQDLFGEGIFAGKGIYEVAIFHQVLDHRFPRNTLLSHDLIEGSYARVGLASDVELIDDYPSRHSAYTRRKHRWVRGDWQIAQWLLDKVPDESGKYVANPINVISRWKIFDNLRRSLVEPITFLLLICGWLFLPGPPWYWTFVTLTLLLAPVVVELVFGLSRAVATKSADAAEDSIRTFLGSLGFNLLTLTFIFQQTLLSLDAIIRSMVRRHITGKRLLEWETAAQSESSSSRSTLDLYLSLSPALSIILAILIGIIRPTTLIAAGPILFLWAIAPLIAVWLDSPLRSSTKSLSTRERHVLNDYALLTWRYFSEFGGAQNHWLIPDNVEEKDLRQVRTLSPTNLGMLINARQAALKLGFITLDQFATLTLNTLRTYETLEKHHGHIYNWYDIETLKPIIPRIISTVDSGNLAAAMRTLHGGTQDLLKQPLLNSTLLEWSLNSTDAIQQKSGTTSDTWLAEEMARRQDAANSFIAQYTPWLFPRFNSITSSPEFRKLAFNQQSVPVLAEAQDAVRALQKLCAQWEESQHREAARELANLLPAVVERLGLLLHTILRISRLAEQFADDMRFDFLFVPSRSLLSIGYDDDRGEIINSCYDLFASEARMAYFLAIATGDIPQSAWFRLDRTHTSVNGCAALISWTGTMFEYMMPALWMRTYPNSLVSRTLDSVVEIQRKHVRGIPWGISESGFGQTDPQGRYLYRAWGVPNLALKYGAEDGPVISPYSTFLAMPFARKQAFANLETMKAKGWVGDYGFYEAVDFSDRRNPLFVRSWMAHHQGMSLMAITNILCEDAFQHWFHENPKVLASELLLHERPLSRTHIRSLQTRSVLKEAKH